MLPTQFRFIWPSGFSGEDLKKSANKKQELPVAAMFVNGLRQNVQFLERTIHRCFLPSFGLDVFYQVSVHLAKRFQRRRILKISQSETRVACGSHVC